MGKEKILIILCVFILITASGALGISVFFLIQQSSSESVMMLISDAKASADPIEKVLVIPHTEGDTSLETVNKGLTTPRNTTNVEGISITSGRQTASTSRSTSSSLKQIPQGPKDIKQESNNTQNTSVNLPEDSAIKTNITNLFEYIALQTGGSNVPPPPIPN